MPSIQPVWLSEDQIKLLQMMLDRMRQLPDPSPHTDYQDDTYPAPDVYIVKTPIGGIPHLTIVGTGTGTDTLPAVGDTLGSASCQVLRVDSSGVLQEVNNFFLTVYNIFSAPIRGETVITAKRDKFGTWIAEYPDIIILRGQTIADVTPGGYADVAVYEGSWGAEVATGRSISNVINNTSCTIKGGVTNTIMHTPDNDDWQFLIYKTA